VGRTTDKDLGRKALLIHLSQARHAYADVGLFEGEGHEGTELSLAEIGAVHEFGTRDGRIPERSWLRRNHDEHHVRYAKMLDAAFSKILTGATDVVSALTAFAEKVASDARRTLTQVREPPLAASTIRAKGGKTNPLIDTGALRAGIRGRVTLAGRKVSD